MPAVIHASAMRRLAVWGVPVITFSVDTNVAGTSSARAVGAGVMHRHRPPAESNVDLTGDRMPFEALATVAKVTQSCLSGAAASGSKIADNGRPDGG
jgi:hypothetical protein